MTDYLTEMMLCSYFTAEVTVGRFYPDKKSLFSVFARIFLFDEEKTAHFYALTQKSEVVGITSEHEYHLHKRCRQYYGMIGRERTDDAELEEIIDLKGTSLSTAQTYGLIHGANEVESVVCENLTLAAENGAVLGLYLLGIFQMEGIVFEKDGMRGISRLRRAADWDSEEGLLAALVYDMFNREEYVSRLHTCFLRAGHNSAFERVAAAYGTYDETRDREFRVLEKAFNQGIVKRDTYAKAYARLIYSDVLEEKDKESIVLSGNKELFAIASALPLQLSIQTLVPDMTAIEELRPARAAESEKVMLAINNIDLRRTAHYRPLCIVSDSGYMLEAYAAAIAKCLSRALVERIEVGDLTGYDIEPSQNHIFIRSCDEDLFNVYFLFFRGKIDDRVFDTAKNFLQSTKRAKFRLNQPSISIDLSMVLPVCFCDKERAAELKPYCDIVRIAAPNKTERKAILAEMMQAKAALYGVGKIEAQAEVEERLAGYPVDEIEAILDRAIREHRMPALVLTEELMKPYFFDNGEKLHIYGFGGGSHED